MSANKKKIQFNDLGLSTPLPELLTKSKADRMKEKRIRKQESKEKVNEATSVLANTRSVVEKHKQHTTQLAEEEKLEKQRRKQELKALHLVSQRERDEEKKALEVKSAVAERKRAAEIVAAKTVEHTEEIQREIRQLEEKMKVGKRERRNVHVNINRTAAILEQRADLPVLREEQPIVEAILAAERSCVLICGETGSGKTTQVPQFLWESGYGHEEGAAFGREGCIAVTEPRRVAAVSMAQRVAEELNVTFGEEVGFHVRYENNISDRCKLKFATEGIILKEIQNDFLLRKYSVIVVDEAHERSVSCDLLIGLLSRIVPLRNDLFKEELRKCGGDTKLTKIKPFRLVIMSATMRVMDFRDNTKLFPITPTLINVEARRFPVTNHFSRKTVVHNYVDEAFRMVRQLHKKLPPGGVLVFLCTQHEIEDFCTRLRNHYSETRIEYYEDGYSKHSLVKKDRGGEHRSSDDDDDDGEKDEFGLKEDDYFLGEEDHKRPRDDTEEEANEKEDEINGELNSMHVLPLYALLDTRKQKEVFNPPPKGKRLCVVSTNVAETSITIPNIRYVVDCGRVKNKTMDKLTQASCYKIEWTSQASAEQRSGRAGRVGPGHCYRLYSTAVYSNVMSPHSVPEILRTPLESVVLLMKHIGIEQVGGFPFPSPPMEEDIKNALIHLKTIGGLTDGTFSITPLGERMLAYPVLPRFARAIVECQDKKWLHILHMVVAIVAMASTCSTPFTAEGNQVKYSKSSEAEKDPRRGKVRSLLCPGSDLITNFRAFGKYLADQRKSCHEYCLVQKSMKEAKMLFYQLCSLAAQDRSTDDEIPDTVDTTEQSSSAPPADSLSSITQTDELSVRKIFIPGLIDQIARRATPQECIAYKVSYNEKKTSSAPYLILSTRAIAFIHPTSSVSHTLPPPEYVLFSHLQTVSRSESKTAQTHMLGVTIVLKEWLLEAGCEDY